MYWTGTRSSGRKPTETRSGELIRLTRYSGTSLGIPRCPPGVPGEICDGTGGGGAIRAMDYKEIPASEEEDGSDQEREENQPLALEVLRARRQASDAAGSHAQSAVASH